MFIYLGVRESREVMKALCHLAVSESLHCGGSEGPEERGGRKHPLYKGKPLLLGWRQAPRHSGVEAQPLHLGGSHQLPLPGVGSFC